MSGTTWFKKDKVSYPAFLDNREVLLQLARPFKDQEGTLLLYTASEEGLGRGFLFVDPYEVAEKPTFTGEDEPLWSGFVTYEGNSYFQKCRVTFSFDPETKTLLQYGESPLAKELFKEEPSEGQSFSFCSSFSKEAFVEGCKKVKELILDGEVYQLNLSHEVQFSGEADPFALFEELLTVSKAPFAAYLCHGGRYYLSLSPERFLSNREGLLQTEPIKGTIPQEKPLENLVDNSKEKAELLMITDLMRNDLSRIAEPKSVFVKSLFDTVSYPHLVHMRSVVQAKLKKGLCPYEALMTIFPGGSITGCPKIKAMEYIKGFEKEPRGVFTGSIGYFLGNGDFDFNIAIRTLVKEGNQWSLKVGSGLVFDSDPEKEYLETLCKARPFFHVMHNASC